MKQENDFVEIEETYRGGFIVSRRVNGIEMEIIPESSDAIIVHRTKITVYELKHKFGEWKIKEL